MLVGVPLRPQLPRPPVPEEGLDGIYRYLRVLDHAVQVYISDVLTGAVGFLGTRGISSTGTISQNFVRGALSIGNQTSAVWSFANIEPDASYILFTQPSSTASVAILSISQTPTSARFNFSGIVPTNATMNVLLLR